MNRTDKEPRDTAERSSDRHLVAELESLYQTVARLDQADSPDEGPVSGIGFVRGMRTQRADAPAGPDAAGRNGRRSDQPPLRRDDLMERLDRIREAYEKMLTCWPYAAGNSPPAGI